MIIHAMVVEDEPPIQRSICQKIEKLNKNFKVTAIADNGRDAILYLKENEVDVIFVDINLPLINGLGVLEYINERNLSVIPVVLSGYKDFEYVKRAFSSHVVDYLLKPIKDGELNMVLDKMEQIHRQKKFEEKSQRLERALGGYSEEKKKNSNEEVCKEYCMLLLTLGINHAQSAAEEWNYAETFSAMGLEEHLVDMLPKESFWIVDGKRLNEKIIFIRKGLEPEFGKIRKIFGEMDHHSFPLTYIYSRIPVEVPDIFRVYREMQQYAEEHRVFTRDTGLVFYQDKSSVEMVYHKEEIDKQIQKCKNAGKKADVFNMFNNLLEKLTTSPSRYKDAVHDIKYFISRVCTELPVEKEYFEVEENVRFILGNCFDREEIAKEFRFLLEKILGSAPKDTKDKKELAKSIKEFLDINYHSNITNQYLAERFGFVASYLSSIFKQYYEATPMEYIGQKRMEEAKYLLRQGDMKIKDVAVHMGYVDSLYFSKVFKKVTGMSPKDYIQYVNTGE